MDEIKIGSIVDVTDGSSSMVLVEDGTLSNRFGEIRSRNPWEVIAFGQEFPTDRRIVLDKRVVPDSNDTMLKNVANPGTVAFTKKKYLKLYIDHKQESIILNEQRSLAKWERAVEDIYSLSEKIAHQCGYCENVEGDCNICSLFEKGLCCRTGGDIAFGRCLRKLREAWHEAKKLRDGIKLDIEEGK